MSQRSVAFLQLGTKINTVKGKENKNFNLKIINQYDITYRIVSVHSCEIFTC